MFDLFLVLPSTVPLYLFSYTRSSRHKRSNSKRASGESANSNSNKWNAAKPGYFFAAACYLANGLPTKALNRKPFMRYNTTASLTYQIYGPKENFAPREWAGTLLGYEAKNQWRTFDGTKVWIRRDAILIHGSTSGTMVREIWY